MRIDEKEKKLKDDKRPEGSTAALDKVLEMMNDDEKIISKTSPTLLVETDLRLREGVEYTGDVFTFDGVGITIPQLTFIQVRKSQRQAFIAFEDKKLLKKIFELVRKLKKPDEKLPLTFEEELKIGDINDVEDLWLIHFALLESGHPKVLRDFEENRKWFERVSGVEDFLSKLKIVNGLNEENSDTPSGEEVIKSFHHVDLRSDVEKTSEVKPVPLKGLDST
jgi:hypothetical protein